MADRERLRVRLQRNRAHSLTNWRHEYSGQPGEAPISDATVDCGWGRLIFGQTFSDAQRLAAELQDEAPGRRDIAIYLRDPHVVISMAPQEVFLDPSHTFRLWLDRYQQARPRRSGFVIRLLNSREDALAMYDLYVRRKMVPPPPEFVWEQRGSRSITYLVAEDKTTGELLGAVTGVDHVETFQDPENGSSLWALTVDPQAQHPGIGEGLVRRLAEHFQARGRAFMDLSVMHDNEQAIGLYEKLGFLRVPVFALKRKNIHNEPLYTGEAPEAKLNPYARIIIDEARRRGIGVEVLDEEAAYFELFHGGRSVACRESLSELTTAVAMSRCDDKAVTHRVLDKAGLSVPAQLKVTDAEEAERFLESHGSVVVKPARGEQGEGISVDVRDPESLRQAIAAAKEVCDAVLLEQFARGSDLRVVVIDYKVVAAAIRKPPEITGTGQHTVRELVEKQSRRRSAATGGESTIPMDAETERCVRDAGFEMGGVLPVGETITVRKTANLHTGGTIHDVTSCLSHTLCRAAVDAAKAIHIPVTGLDFIVPSVEGREYVIIEANERPGLANHEPQPTAQRFIDLLFPHTAARARRSQEHERKCDT
ncbi:MAG: N-acetylglutaminylglutamine synthetase [Gammaproteobacteria bacterium]